MKKNNISIEDHMKLVNTSTFINNLNRGKTTDFFRRSLQEKQQKLKKIKTNSTFADYNYGRFNNGSS